MLLVSGLNFNGCRLPVGQFHEKCAARSDFAPEAHGASHEVYIVLYNVEAQSGTLCITCVVGTEEAVENMPLILLGNTDTLVLYLDADQPAPIIDPQKDRFLRLRVLDRIRKQVEKHIT